MIFTWSNHTIDGMDTFVEVSKLKGAVLAIKNNAIEDKRLVRITQWVTAGQRSDWILKKMKEAPLCTHESSLSTPTPSQTVSTWSFNELRFIFMFFKRRSVTSIAEFSLEQADMYHQHNRSSVCMNQHMRKPNAILLHQTLIIICNQERQHSTKHLLQSCGTSMLRKPLSCYVRGGQSIIHLSIY